jgi:hypothetical protein
MCYRSLVRVVSPAGARAGSYLLTARVRRGTSQEARVEIRISYKVIMDVRSCAARLAVSPLPVTGGGSLLLSAMSPVMGISSRADRVYQQS